MSSTIISRIKSYFWRAGGFAFLAAAAYVLKIGDIWKLDYKILVNLSVLAALGILVGEITKLLNTSSEPVPEPLVNATAAEIPVTRTVKAKKKAKKK